MTYAPPTLTALARYWVSKGGVNLGVVGDTRHAAKGRSYHLGQSALTSDAYSRKTARDRAGLSEAASALDIGKLNGSYIGLRKFSVWLVKRCQANAPGTQDIREVIYSPDGKTVLRWDRERGLKSEPRAGEADASHLGHTHISFYRDSEKRPKTAAFSPYFDSGPAQPKQEAPVGNRIVAAAKKQLDYYENVLEKDPTKALGHALKADGFVGRLIAPLAPPVSVEEDELELSPIPAIATAQLIAASGAVGKANDPKNPAQLTYEQADVLAGSTPDANRLLALLGFFGQPGDLAGADYSLFERYFDELPVGLDVNGQPTEGNWVQTDPNTNPYVAYTTGQ